MAIITEVKKKKAVVKKSATASTKTVVKKSVVKSPAVKKPAVKKSKTTVVKPSEVIEKKVSTKRVKKVVEKVIETDPNKIVPSEIKSGVYFYIKESATKCSKYGCPAFLLLYKNKIPCKVTDLREDSLNLMPVVNSYFTNGLSIYKKDIELISNFEAEKESEKHLLEYRQKYDSEFNKILRTLNIEIKDTFSRKDSLQTGKLNTNINILSLRNGIFNQPDLDPLSIARSLYGCCSATKTTSDIIVWIPEFWLNYCGYQEKDLMLWLDFCSKIGTNFNYKYLGSKPFHKLKVGGNPSTNFAVPFDDKVHCVLLKGTGVSMHTYLNFMLLRYMYNHQYYTIPYKAMQLKATSKNELSFWDCILLAHNARSNYYNYYCWVSTCNNVVLPKSNPMQRVLNNLKSRSANESFTYSSIPSQDFYKSIDNLEIEKLKELCQL